MKVLFISSDNNATSGAFLSMVKLNKLLHDCFDVETTIILPKNGDGDKILDEQNINYQFVKSVSWIVRQKRKSLREKGVYLLKVLLQPTNVAAVLRLRKMIKEEHYDIVHCNTTFTYVGALAAKGLNCKVIWHLREFLEEDRNLKIINRRLGYNLIARTDKVVAISESIFQKYYPFFEDKLVRIYNGIDVEDFYYKHELFTNEQVNLLIVGSVSPEKGQLDVIRAFRRFKDTNLHLNIVGKFEDSAYKEKIEASIQKYGISNKLTFWGKRSDVFEFQKKADIVFVCSRAEAFGRVTVEALLAGCLVIGANCAGTTEILGNGKYGLLYTFGNDEELAEKIRYAIENKKEMKELALTGQDYASETYTALKNAQNVYELYRSVLKKQYQEI